jgi:NhaP-type Na+/H+ or K+/H+ antiporter
MSTFGVWLLSERLTLSPIITVVVYAMTLAQASSGQLEQISLGLNRRDSQRPANEGVSCP